MNLDIRTIVFLQALFYLFQLAVLVFQYAQTRKYAGLRYWIAADICLGLAFLLSSLRAGEGLDFLFIVSNNLLYMAGFYLTDRGVREFLGIRKDDRVIFFLMGASALVSVYFSLGQDSLLVRRVNISLIMGILAFFITWNLFRHPAPAFSRSSLFLRAVYGSFSAAFFARGAAALVFEGAVRGAFDPASLQTYFYLIFLILGMLATFGYILTVNESLVSESREDRRNLQTIFDTSPDAVIISDLETGRLVKFNQGFLDLTEYAAGEVEGKSTLEINFWSDPEDRARAVAQLKALKTASNLEYDFLTKSGRRYTGLVSAKVITLDSRPHLISVIRDISAKKQMEGRLEAEIRTKNQLFSLVAHDLKNSLGGTKELTSLLSDNFTQFTEGERRDMLSALKDSSENLYGMLENLLFWARSQQQSITLRPLNFPLEDLVRDTVEKLRSALVQKCLEVLVDIPPGWKLNADRELLRIVVRNLLTNAVNYSPDGSKILVTTGIQGAETAVSIENAGAPLPPAVRDLLDRQSTVIPENPGYARNGTGVGLPLCIDFLRRMGGRLEARSLPESRIRFMAVIPVSLDPEVRDPGGAGSARG